MKHKLSYSSEQIRRGCVLAMCVHIAAIPRMPNIACENSWDNVSYSFQSYESTDGTITISKDSGMIVGALRNNDRKRIIDYPSKNAMDYYADASEEVKALAQNETLQYLLMLYEQKKSMIFLKRPDIVVPVITTAFWSESDEIYSSDSEKDFFENGGDYIENICLPQDKLLEVFSSDYGLTDKELEFAMLLFDLKNSGVTRILNVSEFASKDMYGYSEFLSVLSSFGMELSE